MRTIKSQDGKMIINAERAWSFSVHDINGKGAVWTIIADSWINDDSWRTIAEYSTETRALKVLDMLNEWLTLDRYILDIKIKRRLKEKDYFECVELGNDYNRFQMPQDSKELDKELDE